MALLHDLGYGIEEFDCDLKFFSCLRNRFGLVFCLCLSDLHVLEGSKGARTFRTTGGNRQSARGVL